MNGCSAATAALLFLIPHICCAAENLNDAARELARKTAAVIQSLGKPAISYHNLSSLPDSEMMQVRREFEAELAGSGEPPAPLEAQVTLSENTTQYLLVEEVRGGAESRVWIASWKRSDLPPSISSGIVLDKKFVWEQDEQILDVAFPGNGMLVLSPSRLTLYTRAADHWDPMETAPLTPGKAWPRDLRGRLRLTGDRIEALLPGMSCRGSAQSPVSLVCRPSEEPWVLESGSRGLLLSNFTPDRNYFDGRVVAQNGSRKIVAPFYSAAAFEDQGNTFWLLALLDGRTQILDSSLERLAGGPVWGSDIVGTSARCAGGSQLLATRAGDTSEPDAVQAFSIVNRAATSVTAPVAFSGPVTALWPSTAASALAVSRDPGTGRYAAYVLTVLCGP